MILNGRGCIEYSDNYTDEKEVPTEKRCDICLDWFDESELEDGFCASCLAENNTEEIKTPSEVMADHFDMLNQIYGK